MLPQFQGALWLVVLAGGLYFAWQNRGLVGKALSWMFGGGATTLVTTTADEPDAMYSAVRTLKPLCDSGPEQKAAWKTLAIAALEYKS